MSEVATQTSESASLSVACQTDGFLEDKQRLDSLQGTWEPLTSYSVQENVVIKVTEDVLSADAHPLTPHTGFRGRVERIDDEGDNEIYFPCIAANGMFKKVSVFA